MGCWCSKAQPMEVPCWKSSLARELHNKTRQPGNGEEISEEPRAQQAAAFGGHAASQALFVVPQLIVQRYLLPSDLLASPSPVGVTVLELTRAEHRHFPICGYRGLYWFILILAECLPLRLQAE